MKRIVGVALCPTAGCGARRQEAPVYYVTRTAYRAFGLRRRGGRAEEATMGFQTSVEVVSLCNIESFKLQEAFFFAVLFSHLRTKMTHRYTLAYVRARFCLPKAHREVPFFYFFIRRWRRLDCPLNSARVMGGTLDVSRANSTAADPDTRLEPTALPSHGHGDSNMFIITRYAACSVLLCCVHVISLSIFTGEPRSWPGSRRRWRCCAR